ncbi:hypothetical protein SAMN05192541_1674 [Bradyrhizobium arachidis]|nr:hypothetical protein SAMN05192541_1674 [Bradyrhizobium arachidis]
MEDRSSERVRILVDLNGPSVACRLSERTRADIHDGPEHERSNQRPDTLMQDRRRQFDESSRNARPALAALRASLGQTAVKLCAVGLLRRARAGRPEPRVADGRSRRHRSNQIRRRLADFSWQPIEGRNFAFRFARTEQKITSNYGGGPSTLPDRRALACVADWPSEGHRSRARRTEIAVAAVSTRGAISICLRGDGRSSGASPRASMRGRARGAITIDLDAGRLPNLAALRDRLRPQTTSIPVSPSSWRVLGLIIAP